MKLNDFSDEVINKVLTQCVTKNNYISSPYGFKKELENYNKYLEIYNVHLPYRNANIYNHQTFFPPNDNCLRILRKFVTFEMIEMAIEQNIIMDTNGIIMYRKFIVVDKRYCILDKYQIFGSREALIDALRYLGISDNDIQHELNKC